MSEKNGYDRDQLITLLGLIALVLFALNFHTYVSRAWSHWPPRCERTEMHVFRQHIPPVPPLPPLPPLPPIEPMVDVEPVVHVEVDLSELDVEMRELEREMRGMEFEIHAEAAREAVETLREEAHAFRYHVKAGKDRASVVVVN